MRSRLDSSKSADTCLPVERCAVTPFNLAANSRQNTELLYLTSFLSNSSRLFCALQNHIPFVLIRFRTLLPKHPGWGYLLNFPGQPWRPGLTVGGGSSPPRRSPFERKAPAGDKDRGGAAAGILLRV